MIPFHRYTCSVIPALESIDWYSFLGRPQLPSPPPSAVESIARNPILITGAGGSIGGALAHRLAAAGAELILLESSESHLFNLQFDLADAHSACSPKFYLGSTGDRILLDEIFLRHQPGLVFHAAAFKQVPLLEEQPFAVISNNILATQSLVAAAAAHRSKTILLSTDKAVAPVSIMGATKRVAEQITLAAGGTALRLANVLGSRGSVAEIFAHQIAAGSALTVTDPAARRFFLTIPEAVNLLLAATDEPVPQLFVPDLRLPHYIADLARFMAHTLAPGRDIPIEFTQLRAGDKESEALFSPTETPHVAQANGLMPVDSPRLRLGHLHDLLEELKAASQSRNRAAALSILQRLVPDYLPSPVVEGFPLRAEPPVHNV